MQLMPDQLSHLSTIINCAEGILFNIQKIVEEKSSTKGLSDLSKQFKASQNNLLQKQMSIEQIMSKQGIEYSAQQAKQKQLSMNMQQLGSTNGRSQGRSASN